jgi:transcriptional regulator with AAA-type ATPase domain
MTSQEQDKCSNNFLHLTDMIWLFDMFYHARNAKIFEQNSCIDDILEWGTSFTKSERKDGIPQKIANLKEMYDSFLYKSSFLYGYIELKIHKKEYRIRIHENTANTKNLSEKICNNVQNTLWSLIEKHITATDRFIFSSLQFDLNQDGGITVKCPIWDKREFLDSQQEVNTFSELVNLATLKKDNHLSIQNNEDKKKSNDTYTEFMIATRSLMKNGGGKIWVIPFRPDGKDIAGCLTLCFDINAKGDAQTEDKFCCDAKSLSDSPDTYVIDRAVHFVKFVALRLYSALLNNSINRLPTIGLSSGGDWNRWNRRKIVGQSKAIQILHRRIDKVTKDNASKTTVMIFGETGTGKELVARAIHDSSLRRNRKFIPHNCGASDELLESKLFGHMKGSFSGATEDRKGIFKEADGGTIFLDEIGEMNPAMQTKLLRVIENGEVTPIGENIPDVVNVRIITATHRNLKEDVKNGRFRNDLFQRLRVCEINTPPLRERPEDISLLAEHFSLLFGKEYITPSALQKLQNYTWSGNVRELKNKIEQAAIESDENCIREEHIQLTDSVETDNPHENTFENIDRQEQSITERRHENFNFLDNGNNRDFWKERVIAAIGQKNFDVLNRENSKDLGKLLTYLPIWKDNNVTTPEEARMAADIGNGTIQKTLARINSTLKDDNITFNWGFVYNKILNHPENL